MRYLILSDIHANLTALDTVLSVAKGRWEKAVCLGDLVGYGPDPNEVIDRVRGLPAVTIRGNHDKAIAGLEDADEFNPDRAQCRPLDARRNCGPRIGSISKICRWVR